MLLTQEENRFLGKVAFASMWYGLLPQGEKIFANLEQAGLESLGLYLGNAQVHLHKGEFDKAKNYIDKAAACDAKDEHVRTWTALHAYAVGNVSEAKDILQSLSQTAEDSGIREMAKNLLEK